MANLKSWQFAFNQLNDLPEMLVQGRERAYLAWIFATKSFRSYAIDSAALEEYTRAVFRARSDARWIRLVPGNLRCRRPRAGKGARGQAIDNARSGARRIRRGGRRASRDGCQHRRSRAGGPIAGSSEGCGHFLPEECPDELTKAVLKFWQSTPR
jgi:pimeloyl-ACP methyl ester carboxylesterase